MKVYFTKESRNAKTGPIPVSTTSADSCPKSCPLQRSGCYADSGPLRGLWDSVTKRADKRAKFWLTWSAFCDKIRALPVGTLWRHNQAGDLPHSRGHIDVAKLNSLMVANNGKRGFTYTHHNPARGGNGLRIWNANRAGFTINLSADSLIEADQFAALKIAPVVVVLHSSAHGNYPIETPQGNRVVVCPATYRADITCQTCKLCQVATRDVIVGFPAHGAGAKVINGRIEAHD